MKKILFIILSSLFIINLFNYNSFASETTNTDSNLATEDLNKASIEFEKMSIEELNNYIDNIANMYSSKINSRGTSVPEGNLQLAWIAAANIAEKKGYPCSAALVKASVYNNSYTEKIDLSGKSKGLFQKKIGNASNYKTFLTKVNAGKSLTNPYKLTFTKKINADLFYSLHKVSAYHTKKTSAKPVPFIRINDTFDFNVDSNYDDLFTTCINNWAWLCQQTKVLHKIAVNIYMQ